MRSVGDWDEADLNSLIDNKVQESLVLDYKDCPSLENNDKGKNDISKDVSAFANSAGGVIIYGIQEDTHYATNIADGYDPNLTTKEWLEQVINSKIHPRLEGLLVKQIELLSRGNGQVVYAVAVPRATARAPHQASDNKYYRRHNFQSVAMEDYEVREKFWHAINYAKRYAKARAMMIEVRRVKAAATARAKIDCYEDRARRDQMRLSMFELLRGYSDDTAPLDESLEDDIVELVGEVDEYNSIVETAYEDENGIRVSNEGMAKLKWIAQRADIISKELSRFLSEQRNME